MMDIITINNIRELHEAFKIGKPKHPLITLIDLSKIQVPRKAVGKRVVLNLYSIYLKNRCFGELTYGRKHYDFHDGVMTFVSPGQSLMLENIDENTRIKGWGLYFHPDLIRRSSLGGKMKDYTFFSYDVNEALHISEKEQETIERIIREIEMELSSNLDSFSHELINSSLELLLNYSKRFYNRQFITRQNLNKDLIQEFEEFLYNKINSEDLKNEGVPTVKDCAQKMCLSPNYLSDLLKKETGKNTKEYIHFYVIERAKNMLLNSNDTVNEIAYELGFEYPEYFSRLFKKKTGISPSKFRLEIEGGANYKN